MHLPRWVRYIRKNVPDAKLYLFLAGMTPNDIPIFAEFERVEICDDVDPDRKWLNSVRMGATTTFKVSEILYLDCDCDVLCDISDLPDKYARPLCCCPSPVIHESYAKAHQDLNLGLPSREFNNGLIYLRRDFSTEYAGAWDKTVSLKVVPDRIAGTVAFNLMLLDMPDQYEEVHHEYSEIWWKSARWVEAKTIQYCNDEGQKKRIKLEQMWRNSR